jgi:hypothetical protein
VKPLSGGIQSWLLKRLEWLINEFPGFPTLFFALAMNHAGVYTVAILRKHIKTILSLSKVLNITLFP